MNFPLHDCTYLCMNVPVHKLTCAWTYLCMDVPVQEHTLAWKYLFINGPVHELICACTYQCMNLYVHERTSAWTYRCMTVHTCAWTYLCLNIPVHERTSAWMYQCMNVPVHDLTCFALRCPGLRKTSICVDKEDEKPHSALTRAMEEFTSALTRTTKDLTLRCPGGRKQIGIIFSTHSVSTSTAKDLTPRCPRWQSTSLRVDLDDGNNHSTPTRLAQNSWKLPYIRHSWRKKFQNSCHTGFIGCLYGFDIKASCF